MSSTKVLVWVRGKVEQKHFLTFCVFGQTRSKCSSSSTLFKSQPQQSLSLEESKVGCIDKVTNLCVIYKKELNRVQGGL
jgi:hypothetical protein